MKVRIKIGQWLVDPELDTITFGDREIHLEPKIMEVLLLLAQEPEVVISKEKLITTVWQNTFVTEQVLTNAIWELRKALGDKAKSPSYIQTVPKKGYRLIAAVSNTVLDKPKEETVPAESTHQFNNSFLSKSQGKAAISAAIIFFTILVGLVIWRTNPIAVQSEVSQITPHQEAQAAYAKGLEQFNKRTHTTLQESLKYFEEAIRLDSTYAAAHSSLAANYILLVPNVMRPHEGYSKARAAAIKAIELNPRLSEAHGSMAMIKLIFERDWAEADRKFQQALHLDSGNTLVRTWYSQYLIALNRMPEAAEQIKIARKLNPNSVDALVTAGQILRKTEQDDEAMQVYQRVIELEPDHISAHNGLGNIYHKKLLLEQARLEYQKVLELMGEPTAATLARDFVSSERKGSELLISKLNVLLKQKNLAPTQIARIFAGFNERDKAFYWLEKGFEEWDAGLVLLKVDESWDNLRGDPRFGLLMQRVGIIN